MTVAVKNWDRHVADAEEVARGPGFQRIRDRILEVAEPESHHTAVDVGAGTGLLALALAECVETVWAIDISPAMGDYLRAKAASAGFLNVEVATSSAVSLPLVDESADLVVSNYCLHHLDAEGKERALAEIYRVLRPGGRLVFGDMMFQVGLADPRNRRIVRQKARAMLQKGPAGAWRLAKNGFRFATRTWEHPAAAEWWTKAISRAGFTEVHVEVLDHEGGLAWARRPD